MNIMSKFNLPTYVKGKSFSEASAIIAKKFKDRNSPEDVATLNELQGRLQQAQEHVKTAQESKSKPQHKMPDGSMMDGASHGKEGATAESSLSENAEGAVPSGAEQLANKYKGGGSLDPIDKANKLKEYGSGLPSKYEDSDFSDIPNKSLLSNLNANNSMDYRNPRWMQKRDADYRSVWRDQAMKRKDIDYDKETDKWSQISPEKIKEYEGKYGKDYNTKFQGANKFEKGGFANSVGGKGFQKGDSAEDFSGSIGAGLGAIGTLADMGNTAFGDTGIDTSGASAAPDVPSVAGTTAMGAVSGAAKGASVAGVPGAIVGGAFGGITSFMGGSNDKKDAQTARVNNSFADHNAASNNYKKGGKMNKYEPGGPINFQEENDSFMNKSRRGQPLANKEAQKTIMDPSSFGLDSAKPITELAKMSTDNKSYNKNIKSQSVLPGSNPEIKGKIGSGKNYAELLRYAPAAMNAAQLAGLKKPGQVGLDRLTNKYNPQRVDERGMQNAAQNAANINKDAILSSSGGSASSARASLLGSERNASKNLSNAYQKATGENRQDNRKGQQFNANIDKANIGQSNQETNLNLEQQAAYRTNKSKLLSQIGNDLGGVGKEELLKKYPEMMGMSYNERGEHLQSIADEKARKKLARLLEKKKKSKKG